ncbi:endonuclease/exonuclease/phosphatase family protein [Sphingomonas sp. AX6]|uniref:endonuclease/exonuclease/phosphatase family protein n=1 Tax=Sphingomonas sp. AX6 TaxID=2653171 RepID=UPI0012F3E5EE|nr:endonuclease/exonuclease/phosphatase family protein [Sphingomonas sp. AX6]VXC94659.1 Endonuclease [Sphingomonas sp. AX6]
MTLTRILLATLLAAIALPATAQPRTEGDLRVMAFNVRLPAESDGPDYWPNRRDHFIHTLRDADADIVGTQELHKVQGDYIIQKLPLYSWFGIDRRGGRGDEHMGVFFRRDRLRVVDLGNFWLSDTPNVPGSISWGHPYPRMVTWGLMERIADAKRFYLVNTHFAYRVEDVDARRRMAEAVAAFVATLPSDVPVVVTGDFNATPQEPAYAVLTAKLADAWTATADRSGPENTFHAFKGKADRRIDWILSRGLETRRAWTIAESRRGRYPSDHFPVVADLRFPPK